MDPKTSQSQDTLDETFDSMTPFVVEDPPIVEQVDTPPPVGTPKIDKSTLKTKLGALASPFKGKSFHLGPIKKNKLTDSKEDSDKDIKETKRWKKKKPKTEEVTTDEDPGLEGESEGISGTEESYKEKKKKKGSARSKAGALVRRLGSLGTRRPSRSSPEPGVGGERRSSGSSSLTPASVRRRTSDGQDGPPSDPSLNDDSGSRYGSVENVESTRPDNMSSQISDTDKQKPQDSYDCEHPTIKESVEDVECSDDLNKNINYLNDDKNNESANTSKSESSLLLETLPELNADDYIATTHPVSTLPFSKSTWKRKNKQIHEIPRPIESPSPEVALRKRIAFVAQTSVCLSEDKEDWVLEEDEEDLSIPRLTRMVKLAQEKRKFTTSVESPNPSQETEKTDDEEFLDIEESRSLTEHVMPPFGDLIDEAKIKADMGTGVSTHPSNSGGERKEHLYKILVIGELGTGKTSIIKRYVHQFFSQHYRATIGVDFALKVLNWDSNTTIRLQLWDIAGQERFGNMTRVYYKEAVGAFIVFDVTRAATFDAVVKWKQDLDSKVQLPDGSPIPCVLLANKCDQQKEGIVNTPVKMDEYCKEKGFSGWFETSAKENINIEEAARSLVNKILINDKLLLSSEVRDAERLSLDNRDGGANNQQKEKQCAC